MPNPNHYKLTDCTMLTSDYFDEAMNRLRTRFLNIDMTAVIHPTPPSDKAQVTQAIHHAVNPPVDNLP